MEELADNLEKQCVKFWQGIVQNWVGMHKRQDPCVKRVFPQFQTEMVDCERWIDSNPRLIKEKILEDLTKPR